MRTELGIPEDRFVMFCGSRFAEDKGHKYLLDSIKRLTELSAVPFTLVLGGDGPCKGTCKGAGANRGTGKVYGLS